MKNKIIKITLPLLLIVLFSFYVSAFAISMPYLESKTIVLHQGATSDFDLVLQNMVSDTDETAMVTIDEGNEIARIIDKKNVYEVPKGTKDTIVHIKINIPNDAPIGKEWTVRFKATPITEKKGGMVQISWGVSDYFKVKIGPVTPTTTYVTKLPKEKYTANVWYAIGLVILAVLTFLAFYVRKRKKQ